MPSSREWRTENGEYRPTVYCFLFIVEGLGKSWLKIVPVFHQIHNKFKLAVIFKDFIHKKSLGYSIDIPGFSRTFQQPLHLLKAVYTPNLGSLLIRQIKL